MRAMPKSEDPSPDDRRLLSLPEAAAFLSIGLRTFKSLVSAGAIPVCAVSPRRRAIRPSDLDAYVRSRCR